MVEKKKVLILDDYQNIRNLIKSFLVSIGQYEILEGKSGKEGLEILKQNSDLDLILLDLNMPEINGFEFLDKRKSINPDVPIIVLSAYNQSEPAFKAIEKGAFAFTPKPIDFQDLQRVITKALEFSQLKFTKETLISFMNQETSYELPSTLAIIQAVSILLKEQLQLLGVGQEKIEMIYVAFNNALINAYEHGNKKDPTKKIFINITFNKENITIKVKDQGNGFDYSKYIDMDTSNLKNIKGKGMLLINFSMDKVSFNDSGNEIIMEKRLL